MAKSEKQAPESQTVPYISCILWRSHWQILKSTSKKLNGRFHRQHSGEASELLHALAPNMWNLMTKQWACGQLGLRMLCCACAKVTDCINCTRKNWNFSCFRTRCFVIRCRAQPSRVPYPYRKAKETHELIFVWLYSSWTCTHDHDSDDDVVMQDGSHTPANRLTDPQPWFVTSFDAWHLLKQSIPWPVSHDQLTQRWFCNMLG